MQFSSKVKMIPYVGKNYLKQPLKILILGLSTYARNKKDLKNHSIDIGNENKDGNGGVFGSRINIIFQHEDESIKNLWERISFQNYIQKVMDTPKQKNSKSDWENAKEPFIEVMNALKPDIVAAIGFQTYDNLPDYGEYYKTIKLKGEEKDQLEIWKYNILEKPIYVCKILHTALFWSF